MAQTTLKMLIQMRRDEVFSPGFVLQAGEPGFEISTNTFKIGDGTKTWAQLDFANQGEIEQILANYKTLQDVVNAVSTDTNVFVDTVAQDTNGVITITTKAVDFSGVKAVQTALAKNESVKNTFIDTIAQDEQGVITVTLKAVDFEDIEEEINNLADYVGTIPNDEEGKPAADDVISYLKEHTRESISDLYNGNILALEEKLEGITDGDTVVDYISRYDSTEIDPMRRSLNELTKEDGVIAGIQADIGHIESTYATKDELSGGLDTTLQGAKDYSDAQDVFHTDMLTVDKFGGIAGGADLNGKTTHQILTDLLYPYIAFVINSSSRAAAAATLECGQSQTLSSATISVTKKKDPITSIKLFNGSTLLEEKTGEAVANGGSITFNGFDAITVTKSNNPNLKFTVTDGTTSTDKNVGASTFVYPYYWGVCAADATIDETLVESLTKKVETKANKSVTYTCANERMVFAYPKVSGYTALKSILDPNNFEIIDGFTCHEVNITGLDGTAVTYYVYVSTAGTSTNFKVQFKY